MKWIWLMSTLLLCDVIVAMRTHVEKSESTNQLSECVVNVCQTHFKSGGLHVVDNTGLSSKEDIVNTVQRKLHDLSAWNILSVVGRGPLLHFGHTKYLAQGYIIFTDAMLIKRQLEYLKQQATWNSRAQFLVFLTNTIPQKLDEREQLVRHVLVEFWLKKVVEVDVLVPKSASISQEHTNSIVIDVYTWFPFKDKSCGWPVVDVVLIDSWKDGRFIYGNKLYPLKVPNDLHGCPLTVATFPWPPFVVPTKTLIGNELSYNGLEIQMMRTIAAVSNMTIDYLPPPPDNVKWGGKLSNGTWWGTMGDIVYGRANVTIASLINTNERIPDFDTSQYYLTNALVWVVPRAKLLPHWQSLFMIFSPFLWMLVILLWLLVSCTFWVQDIFKHYKSRGLSTYLLLSLGALLGVSVHNHTRIRLFFILYVFYSLQINTAYQSSLVSFLTKPAYHKQVTNERELVDSGMTMGCIYGYEQFFDETDPKTQHLVICNSHEICMDKVVNSENFAVVCDRAYATYIAPSLFVDSSGQPLLVIFNENILFYFVGMMFAKGNILLYRFNDIIERVNEAGLMSKWREDLATLLKSNSSAIKYNTLVQGPVKLSVSHLQGAFIIYILGSLFGMIIFFGEIVCHL